jgi:metal-responsive CopG/Arc/MetJ family transcriptional regulator
MPAILADVNSGRPIGPDGPTSVLAVSVPEKLIAELDEFCETKEWKRSKAVTEAIRGLLNRKTSA